MRKGCLLMVMALMPLMALAEGGEAKKSQNLVVKGLMWVKTLIDSMAVANVDRSYIEQPRKPWAVEVRTSASQSRLDMEADWNLADIREAWIRSETDNGFSTSMGAWVGYRGYGFGLSKELTGGEGSTLSFGAMGGSFGINLRINSYRSKKPDLRFYFEGVQDGEADMERANLEDPIRVRSLFLDGYYLFNGKHFSYAAAYDQSLIQRRSAGSLMAGVMYYHSSVAYDDNSNWPLLLAMRGVGKLKFSQASVGAGYAYNWVPARGWLVSAQVMPMVTFYNNMKTYTYSVVDAMGKNVLERLIEDDFEVSDGESATWKITEREVRNTTNRVNWNFDARMSVSYNWSGSYLRLYGHYNRFRYSNDEGKGHMQDWTAYASFGVRF